MLFNRINNRLLLTDEGRQLYIKAKKVIKHFNEFENLAEDKVAHPTIVLGCSLTVSTIYLSKILSDLQTDLPNVNINVVVNNAMIIQNEILNGRIDIGIIEGNTIFANISSKLLYQGKMSVGAKTDFNVDGIKTFSDIIKYPLLLREKGSYSRDYFDSILGLEVKPYIESNSNQTIISCCQDGIGIAVLPDIMVSKHIEDGTLKNVYIKGVELIAPTTVIWHKNRKIKGAFKDVIGIIEKNIKPKMK